MNKNIQILLLSGLLFFSACSQDEEIQDEKLIPVNVYKVQPDRISEYIKLTGSITGENDAIVYSKISEKLDKINVKPGQRVNDEDILAVQYNTALRQMVDIAKTAVKNAQAQFEMVNQDYERMSTLYNQKALSQQQYDQIKTQKETVETGLEQAKLQLEQAEENYQNSFIKAPFNGVVGAIFFEQNQMIPAGQPVVQIVSPDAMKSKLRIPSKEISAISLGQGVVVKFPSIPGKEYKGKVVNINYAIDPISNLLEVEVQLLNPDKQIKSGIFGEFLIETNIKEGIVALPESSLMPQTEILVNRQTGIQQTVKKFFVFVVENEAAKLKEVKTGISSNGRVEIMEGLKNNDTIIVVGQNIVRDGQKIKVVD